MSTLRERRDVFWKAKAKTFAKQRDAEAHRRREAEIKASDAIGCRKGLVKQFRKTRRWARAWKTTAKGAMDMWEMDENKYQTKITELKEALRWLVHLGHDVGKAGGRPEPGEWKDALDQGQKVLDYD